MYIFSLTFKAWKINALKIYKIGVEQAQSSNIKIHGIPYKQEEVFSLK